MNFNFLKCPLQWGYELGMEERGNAARALRSAIACMEAITQPHAFHDLACLYIQLGAALLGKPMGMSDGGPKYFTSMNVPEVDTWARTTTGYPIFV